MSLRSSGVGTIAARFSEASAAFISKLVLSEGEHIVDRTLDELERSLDPEAFLRVHRSALVNLAFVRDLTSIEGGRFVITLKDATGSQVYASRAGARALRARLGF